MKKIENKDLGRVSVEEFAKMEKTPLVVMLNSVRSLNNVGAIFRSGDAFAIEEVVLCGITATPPNKEIHKTALGAELSVKWSYYKECRDAVEFYKAKGYKIFAVEQVEQSIMLDKFEVDPNQRYVVVLGNEVMGVDQEIVDMCDGSIEIPQIGTKHSLNVSVAGGVVMWHIFTNLANQA